MVFSRGSTPPFLTQICLSRIIRYSVEYHILSILDWISLKISPGATTYTYSVRNPANSLACYLDISMHTVTFATFTYCLSRWFCITWNMAACLGLSSFQIHIHHRKCSQVCSKGMLHTMASQLRISPQYFMPLPCSREEPNWD